MKRLNCAVVVALLCTLSAALMAQEVLWQADLSAPRGGFDTYHQDGGGVTIEQVEVDGIPAVIAEMPGRQTLERICARNITGLPAGRLCTFAAEVRGQGEVWLMAYSSNGWLYSPNTVELTDQWQEIALTKPLGLDNAGVSVCLVIKDIAPLHLEIKFLQAHSEPTPQLWDREVPPVRFEAKEFSMHADKIAQDAGAGGGEVVSDARHMYLRGIPCPRTNKPVYVYLRAKMPETEGYFSVISAAGSAPQRLNRMYGELTGDWQWVSDKPFTPAMVGDTFSIEYFGPKAARQPARVDYLVLTTNPDATAEQLSSAPPVRVSDEALFGVSRAQQPPVLDGRGDDPCWAEAPALNNFVRQGTFHPAKQPSEMRFCYDDDNLYWFFRGQEAVLQPALNQLHEFKQSVTGRDANVWNDDSILLIADPDASGQHAFDVVLNALGTVADARIAGEDLWRSREPDFNVDVEAISEIGDGYWTVEARIGFAGLGVQAFKPGDAWRAIVGRIEQAEKENSSWNLCTIGFHDPTAFARMVFLEAGAGASVRIPPRLQLGDNPFTATLTTGSAPAGYYLYSRLAHEAGFADSWTFAESAAGSEPVAVPLHVAREGDVKLTYGVLDAVSLRPMLVSPAYPRSVKSSLAQVCIDSSGPYRLYLNSIEIASGGSSKPDTPIKAFLQKGVNTFGLALERGTAQIEVSAGGLTVSGARGWRLAPDDVTDFSAPTLDPKDWQPAPLHNGNGGSRLGNPDGPSRMRLSILWEDTRIFPNPTPALYLARGSNQHFTVIARGLPGHRLEGYCCHLALPPELQLVGVTGYYGVRETQPKYAVTETGEAEYDGSRYRHYVIATEQPIPYRSKVRILELFNVLIKYDEAAGEPQDRNYPIYFGAEALDGNIIEVMRPFAVRILPALQGQQPSRLVWQLWGGFFGSINKPEMKQATMQTMQQAGFNNLVSGDRESSDLGDPLAIDNVMAINFEPWSISMKPWLEQHPDDALIDNKGEQSDKYVCTSILLDAASSYIKNDLGEEVAASRADYVTWDFESGVTTGYLSCYCPRCLAAFREFAEIGAEVELSPDTIESDYLPQWTDFMDLRMAKLAKVFKAAVNSADPPAQFMIYSGYHSEDTKWRYGVDWKLIGDLEATDIALCGYGRDYEWVRATVEALQGIPLVCGKLMHPYDRDSDDILVPLTKAVLLRRLFDSTGGILVYDRMPMAGRSWQASAEASRLAAAYEEVFIKGAFVEVPGVPASADWLGARKHGNTLLIALMNITNEEKTYSFALPEGYANAVEFYTGDAVSAGDKLQLKLAPGAALVYVLTE